MRSVANHRIWAPWRLPYVKDASKDNEAGCIFCIKPGEDDDEKNLICLLYTSPSPRDS